MTAGRTCGLRQSGVATALYGQRRELLKVFRDQELDHYHVVPAAVQKSVLFMHANFSPAVHTAEGAAGIIVGHKPSNQFVVPGIASRMARINSRPTPCRR